MEILVRAVGRRKEAVAQVQIVKGTGKFLINNKLAEDYLQHNMSSLISVKSPFDVLTANVNVESSSNEPTLKVTLENTPSLEGSNEQPQLGQINTILRHLQCDTIVKVKGGGLIGQSDAIKLGIARAICELAQSAHFTTHAQSLAVNANATSGNTQTLDTTQQTVEVANSENNQKFTIIRKQLKTKGYLTQDSRVIERKKYGLRKARKAPQYHKR